MGIDPVRIMCTSRHAVTLPLGLESGFAETHGRLQSGHRTGRESPVSRGFMCVGTGDGNGVICLHLSIHGEARKYSMVRNPQLCGKRYRTSLRDCSAQCEEDRNTGLAMATSFGTHGGLDETIDLGHHAQAHTQSEGRTI